MLRADVVALQNNLRQLRIQLEGIAPQVEGRVREHSGESERQALAQRVDGLSTSLSSLTRRVDDLSTRVETMSRQARPTGPAPAPVPPAPAPAMAPTPSAAPRATAPAPAPGPPVATPGARPSTGALQPQDVYQAAYID